jgi:hypothetical protein
MRTRRKPDCQIAKLMIQQSGRLARSNLISATGPAHRFTRPGLRSFPAAKFRDSAAIEWCDQSDVEFSAK